MTHLKDPYDWKKEFEIFFDWEDKWIFDKAVFRAQLIDVKFFISNLLHLQEQKVREELAGKIEGYFSEHIRIHQKIIDTHDIAPFEWHEGRIEEAQTALRELSSLLTSDKLEKSH